MYKSAENVKFITLWQKGGFLHTLEVKLAQLRSADFKFRSVKFRKQDDQQEKKCF